MAAWMDEDIYRDVIERLYPEGKLPSEVEEKVEEIKKKLDFILPGVYELRDFIWSIMIAEQSGAPTKKVKLQEQGPDPAPRKSKAAPRPERV